MEPTRSPAVRTVGLILVLPLSLLATACANPVRDDLRAYVIRVSQVGRVGDRLRERLNAVIGENFRDAKTMYRTFQEVTPEYRDFVNQVEAIASSLRTEEVRHLHEIFIESANAEFSSVTLTVAALERQDAVLLSQANERSQKANKLSREYSVAFRDLTTKYKVEVPAKAS